MWRETSPLPRLPRRCGQLITPRPILTRTAWWKEAHFRNPRHCDVYRRTVAVEGIRGRGFGVPIQVPHYTEMYDLQEVWPSGSGLQILI